MPALSADEWKRRKAVLEEHDGNVSAAAKALGVGRSTLRGNIAKRDDDGFRVTHTSTLYDMETGDAKLQWVKEAVDKEKQELIVREMIAGLVEGIKPAKPTTRDRKTDGADICVAYLIGDAHVGMYSWEDETGADFDTTIAQRDLVSAADRLLASTPASDECIVVQLGDFFHMDSSANATPRSNNRLDVDTRFAQVIRVGIQTMRYMIDLALRKHGIVRVRNVAGNHDPHSSLILTEALRGYYIDEPRVIIECSPKPFWTFRFGNCLVGITHGHGSKPDNYAGMLAVEGHADWSHCEYRYVWHGHFHSKSCIEKMGVITECFRTLAARDAWHAENGYRAGREMQAITLHKDFGEIERHTASLKQIRGVADGTGQRAA
jgi:hypothetical protein